MVKVEMLPLMGVLGVMVVLFVVVVLVFLEGVPVLFVVAVICTVYPTSREAPHREDIKSCTTGKMAHNAIPPKCWFGLYLPTSR